MQKNDATMRKNRLIRLGRVWMLAALMVALMLGMGGAEEAEAAQSGKYIGEARARAIALGHAGTSEADATVVKMKRYDKRSRMIYDVIFLTADARYRYEIDAASGEILTHYRNERSGPGSRPAAGQGEASGQYIGMERAKEIAFAHAKVSASDVRKLKVELDRDDGRMIYEIDAETGDILMWEVDRD